MWERFGDVDTYNEPFAGSLAVLLERPHPSRIETVNDLDCYLANFWRALANNPDGVAKHADWPVNEADLHARHKWLVQVARPTAERVMAEPDFYDVKIAGWWVWGQCLWIGSGWCQRPEWKRVNAGRAARGILTEQYGRAGKGIDQHRRTHLSTPQGITAKFGADPSNQKKRPKLRKRGTDGVAYKRLAINGNGESGGVHRRWQGGGQGGGSGVHAPCFWKQTPDISGDSGAAGRGIHGSGFEARTGGLYEYMNALSVRLRRVRVCCGDWARVLTPSVTTYIGTTGVFLDPPYDHALRERCYSEDHNISSDVRKWALENGDNPLMRIALCGYDGEHDMPATWEVVAWKAHGGYSRSERGVANRSRERIWFSPNCLKAKQQQLI